MLKLFGALLIIICSTFWGLSYSTGIEKRYKELLALKNSITILQCELEYTNVQLGAVIRNVISNNKEHSSFWVVLEEKLSKKEAKTFRNIWYDSIRVEFKNSYLHEGDLLKLLRLGETLGMADRNQQINMIKLYLKTLDQTIQQLEREKLQNKKMAQSLGVVMGIFVVVILY